MASYQSIVVYNVDVWSMQEGKRASRQKPCALLQPAFWILSILTG